MTAEEFAAWVGDRRCELVDGEVIDQAPVGHPHGTVQGDLITELNLYLRTHEIGRAMVEVGFVLARDPDVVRAPDVALILNDQIEALGPSGFADFAPALAVEVVSPSDSFTAVSDKAYEYLRAGTRLVWVVDPKSRRVFVFSSSSEPVQVLCTESVLTGGELLPGFEVPLSRLFR